MRHLSMMLAFSLSFFSLAPVWADAPAKMPGVLFSPAVVDFGLVPSHSRPTQLVTVTFDRRVFSPDHLPTLHPTQSSNSIEVSLFARFDEPSAIRIVYQVVVNANWSGPIRDTLVLTTDRTISDVQLIPLASGSAELPVLASIIPSLTASPSALDFGNVPLGKSKSVKLAIGYYGPGTGLVREFNDAEKRGVAKPDAEFPSNTPGLANTIVTSSSSLMTARYSTEMGLNASVWQTWVVTFKSRLPLGRDCAWLQFKTQAGYYITVPITAEVVAPMKPELHTPKKH